MGSWQLAVGSGQWAVGSGQWAVGSGQLAVGSGEGREFWRKGWGIYLMVDLIVLDFGGG